MVRNQYGCHKNKCNNDILLLPEQAGVFHNCPSRPIFTYQPLVMAIFTISFKYDRRYGLFIKIMHKYNFKIFFSGFLIDPYLPRSRDQAHSHTTLGLKHTRGLGLGWQEHQSFSLPVQTSFWVSSSKLSLQTDPLILLILEVCLSILWKALCRNNSREDSQNNNRAVKKLSP